jgi:NAD-dependent dihydropyrimidine dehydrogenase PreA subunit
MRIDSEKCTGCGLCIPYCTVNAISIKNGKAWINESECVECYACLRAAVCPTNAINATPLQWPRSVRHKFSAVKRIHEETRIPGRGTEEMKTNDVTGRFKHGEVGFSIDVGRPGVGTTFEDVEKIAMALARLGVEFEPLNPVTFLMEDKNKGRIRDDVKKEKALSAIIEFKTKLDKFNDVIKTLREVSKQVNTVFSVGAVCKVGMDGEIPLEEVMITNKILHKPNGKTNIGLGKPAYKF